MTALAWTFYRVAVAARIVGHVVATFYRWGLVPKGES